MSEQAAVGQAFGQAAGEAEARARGRRDGDLGHQGLQGVFRGGEAAALKLRLHVEGGVRAVEEGLRGLPGRGRLIYKNLIGY